MYRYLKKTPTTRIKTSQCAQFSPQREDETKINLKDARQVNPVLESIQTM